MNIKRRGLARFMSLICASAMLLVPASSALAQHNAEAAAAAESSTSTVSNLATMATVTASGREVSSGFGPELAADNQDLPDNPTDKSVHNASGASRWSADRGSGPWWLAYEFPGEATISSVNIAWGNTYATNYSIQTSDDGSNWTDVKTGLKATAQAQWVKTTFDTPIKTRHIRMIATTKSQSWSLSVWEMRTMGTISSVATDPLSRLTPRPLYAQSADGKAFELKKNTCVSVSDGSLLPAVDVMRDELGTSYGLELAEGTNCPITFTLDENLDVTGHVGSAQSITADEAYTIVSDADSVTVKARSATAGIWAAQTLLQLIGPWTNSTVKLADVAFIPAVNIADAPRYQWRGVLVDPARSFYPLDEMKQMIDVMSAYKMNTLHLHLSEDEGFRVEITNDGRADGDTTDYTQLAIKSGAISYQSAWTSNWSPAQDGRTGYWTQSEFIELVAYAADHGIAIVPEIDGPGHSFSLLHGLAELNTGNSNPKPAAGENTPAFIQSAQGRSSLATDADITYTVLGHIMDQLDGMIDKGIKASTMPASELKRMYFHLGGDELFLSGGAGNKTERLQEYLGRSGALVKERDKTTIVWNDGLDAVDQIPEGSVVQHWTGNAANNASIQKLLNQRNGKIIMSPAGNTYFPQRPGTETTGVTWACGACTTSNFYQWNPTSSAGTTEDKVLGVEDALWSEHLRSLNDAEFLMYTRMMATAEVGWTQQNRKDYDNWNKRVGDIAIDLMNRGANFHKATEVTSWKGSYAAVDAAEQKVTDGKVLVGRYAEPGLTGTDGLSFTATYTAEGGTAVNLPVTPDMKQTYSQQQLKNGRLVVNGAHMNSIVDVYVTLPSDVLAADSEAVGRLDVSVSSSTYPIPSDSSMSIAIKDGKVTQTWTGDERPTPDPDPEPEVTVISIKASTSQSDVKVGDTFDPSKVKVVATKSDKTTAVLAAADYTIAVTDKDGNAIDVTKPFEAAGDLTVTVALKDDGSIKDSFTMTVTDKGTVDPDPDPTPKPNPDPQKPSGDNKPQIKPEGGKPGDVVAETGASVSGAALVAMICAAGAIVMLAVRRQRR